jgi:hypothetical protein
MGANNAQANAVTRKLSMQLVQHTGAGEINIWRGGKITGDQTDGQGQPRVGDPRPSPVRCRH